MKEISLNILDVAQNSLRANATEINILVFFDTAADRLTVSIKDNGCGMSQEFVSRVLDPFTTTRTTRRVGLGLPLFRQSALEAGGDFSIESREGKGTEVAAWFRTSHIDRMPLGDLAGTVTTRSDIFLSIGLTTESLCSIRNRQKKYSKTCLSPLRRWLRFWRTI